MDCKVLISIKAILFGVTESVIGNLGVGNNYEIKKDNMLSNELLKEFDYTTFGIRRIYEGAKINEDLDVAMLTKSIELMSPIVKYVDKDGICVDGISLYEYADNLENAEVEYIDKKMRLIRLFCENSFNIKELLFNVYFVDKEGKKSLYSSSKRPFPDVVYGDISKLSLADKDTIYSINKFLCTIDLSFPNSKFDSEKLESACFLYDQTYTASVLTLRFMAGVVGIESLMVNDGVKGDLSYRFSRNCAMLLSNNEDEYMDLKKKLSKIYDLRSKYVHCANVKKLDEIYTLEVRNILRNVIFKIVELNIDKKTLLDRIDLKGYIVGCNDLSTK